MTDQTLLTVKNISRYYGRLTAVDSISFTLKRGEVLGFLGPNGAGKSTSMQMITGNLAPSRGQINVCGFDLLDCAKQAKTNIGYLPEQPPLYRELSVDEYLRFCAKLHHINKHDISAALGKTKQRCGLAKAGSRLINNLSKGYQQRVGIAQAIIHNPAIVVLDEPTVGLDPIQIREIRTLIRELANDHGVLLSTHILPEVQMICDRVQIINQGQLVFSDSINNLNQRMQSNCLIVGLAKAPEQHLLTELEGVNQVERISDKHFRIFHDPVQGANVEQANKLARHIARIAVDKGWALFELSPEHKTLEQVFVELTSADTHTETATELNPNEDQGVTL